MTQPAGRTARTGRPVRRRRPAGTTLVTLAAVAVLAAVLLLLAVLKLAQSPGAKINLGAQVFTAGKAKDLVNQIDKPPPFGGPLLFQALVQDRDVYLQHLGSDPLAGWVAFEAHAPGGARTCVLQWQAPPRTFRDPCSGRTYPADGTGLVQFRTTVAGSPPKVIVDLHQPLP